MKRVAATRSWSAESDEALRAAQAFILALVIVLRHGIRAHSDEGAEA
jgi:hypothetical protein